MHNLIALETLCGVKNVSEVYFVLESITKEELLEFIEKLNAFREKKK